MSNITILDLFKKVLIKSGLHKDFVQYRDDQLYYLFDLGQPDNPGHIKNSKSYMKRYSKDSIYFLTKSISDNKDEIIPWELSYEHGSLEEMIEEFRFDDMSFDDILEIFLEFKNDLL